MNRSAQYTGVKLTITYINFRISHQPNVQAMQHVLEVPPLVSLLSSKNDCGAMTGLRAYHQGQFCSRPFRFTRHCHSFM